VRKGKDYQPKSIFIKLFRWLYVALDISYVTRSTFSPMTALHKKRLDAIDLRLIAMQRADKVKVFGDFNHYGIFCLENKIKITRVTFQV